MKPCQNCGSRTIRNETLPEWHDDLMGVEICVLDAIIQQRCAQCGQSRGITIPNLPGLIAAVAVVRAINPVKLGGAEVKFLRRALSWKAKELAEKLNITPEHLSRVENEAKVLSEQPEKYLRLLVCNLLGELAPAVRWDAREFVDTPLQPLRPDDFDELLCFVKVMPEEMEETDEDSYQLKVA